MSVNQIPENDPLATFDKRPAVSFDPGRGGHPMGEWAVLQVDGYADTAQRRDDKKQPMVYADTGKPMLSMVLPVKEKVGEEWVDKSLWSKIPGGLLTALRAAQQQLQEETGDPTRRVRAGDTLAVRWSANGQKTDNDPMKNPPKIFEAKVKAGVAPPPSGNVDPFEAAASQPATPAGPPIVAQPTPVEQAKPNIGGDPFSTPVSDAKAASPAAADDPFGGAPADEPPF